MLQYRAVYPETLELLKRLMQLDSLSSFNLVGGTALALQLGHRISVDLDLFGKEPAVHDQILTDIKKWFIEDFSGMAINSLSFRRVFEEKSLDKCLKGR